MVWLQRILFRTFRKVRALKFHQEQQIFKVRYTCQSTVAYVWGAGDGGQLGNNTKDVINSSPVQYPTDEEASHISCGYGFTTVSQKHSSQLMISGVNTSLQSERCSAVALPVESVETRIKQISCGRSHILVLTDKEGVFAVGGNSQGQCGIGEKSTYQVNCFQRLYIPESEKILKVVCGLDHSLFLTESGRVYSCGWGADGQTGQGHFEDEPSIKQVKGQIENVLVKDMASSADCCLALSDKGEVFCWGNSEYDQLGIETNEKQISVATKAPLLNALGRVDHVAAAGSFSLLVTEDGAVYTWGYGVLGHGPSVTSSKIPKRIKALDNIDEPIIQVQTGLDHAAIVTASGKLYIWGRGSFGRLGLGQTADQWTPEQVKLPGPVVEVSCGVDHMGVIVETT